MTQASAVPPLQSYSVPGVYLVRCGEEVRNELRYAGLLLARRFLAHALNSDYLLVFNPKILALHCKIEEGSWASRVKSQAVITPSLAQEVVAVLPSAPPPSSPVHVKKSRPGRRTRQMLKALITASAATTSSQAPVTVQPAPVPVVDIPSGANLSIRGSGPSRPMFFLRPFHVDDVIHSDLDNVEPHLTIFLPPGPSVRVHQNRESDAKALAHVDACHDWIRQVIACLETCGLLPPGSCRVLLAVADLSRLSRPNLISLQCRFRDDLPICVRNATHAILRSSVWFKSLLQDDSSEPQSYLVRCWWKQQAVTSEPG